MSIIKITFFSDFFCFFFFLCYHYESTVDRIGRLVDVRAIQVIESFVMNAKNMYITDNLFIAKQTRTYRPVFHNPGRPPCKHYWEGAQTVATK